MRYQNISLLLNWKLFKTSIKYSNGNYLRSQKVWQYRATGENLYSTLTCVSTDTNFPATFTARLQFTECGKYRSELRFFPWHSAATR